MNIICASYHNIWPFQDQTISLLLKTWKYLIKAPIWSGKSFLFFDGLVYGLYGYSKRDMLNVNCKQWRVKILFENDDETYLLERPLSGKKGTKLYKISWWMYAGGGANALDTSDSVWIYSFFLTKLPDIVNWDVDFADFLDQDSLEPIVMHTSIELQQHIELLLPPRSVFMQKSILMQDSENLFELQPKARIDVLKLMFGLDMIDTIRNSLWEIKSELRGQYKVLDESNHIALQYRQWYKLFGPLIESLWSKVNGIVNTSDFPVFQQLSEYVSHPLSEFADSLSGEMENRDLSERCQYRNDCSMEYATLLQDIQKTQQEHKALESVLTQKNTGLAALQTNIEQKNNTQHRIRLVKDKLDEQLLRKKQLEDSIDLINGAIPKESRALFADYGISLSDYTLSSYRSWTEQLVQLGKAIRSSKEARQAKKDLFDTKIHSKDKDLEHYKQQLVALELSLRSAREKALQHQVESLQQKIANTEEKIRILDNQKQKLAQWVVSYKDQLDVSSTMHCDLDHEHCPMVQEMTVWATQKLTLQIEQETHQLDLLAWSIQALQDELVQYHKELTQVLNAMGLSDDWWVLESSDYHKLKEKIALLEKGGFTQSEMLEQKHILAWLTLETNKLAKLKTDYESLISILDDGYYEKYEAVVSQLQQLNVEMMNTQRVLQGTHEEALDLAVLESQSAKLQQEIQETSMAMVLADGRLQDLIDQSQSPKYKVCHEVVQLNKQAELLLSKAKDLYREKLRVDDSVKAVKEELEQATILHTVFGKELTLYVLQSYIPLLNEYINAFLAKVVSFQLHVGINQDGDELELTIEDEFGTREVKSLSGGQKTILRLCRILATSVVFRNSFLLLDETINNIDVAVVAKVGELLMDYVQQYNLTFYTVTHSEQIQSMSIWDSVIELTPKA